MSGAIVLRRCATVEEAIVIDSALKAGGFQSSLGEYYFAHVQWDAIAAIGGVSILLPSSQFDSARKYLAELRSTAFESLADEFDNFDMRPLKLRWARAWSMLILYSPVGVLLCLAFAYVLSLLPVDWVSLAHANYTFSDFGPVVSTSYDGGTGSVPLAPEGLAFLLFIAFFILWDMLDVTDRKRLAQPSPEDGKKTQT